MVSVPKTICIIKRSMLDPKVSLSGSRRKVQLKAMLEDWFGRELKYSLQACSRVLQDSIQRKSFKTETVRPMESG